MTLIRTGTRWGKRTSTLVLCVGLVASCGRVESESETGNAGAGDTSGMTALGGSNDAGADAMAALGGSSDAGAPMRPSAGSDSGGSGGASGSPDEAGAAGAAGEHSGIDLLLPSDCEPHGRSATETACALNVTCHGEQNSVQCERLASGAWQCSCAPNHSERTLEIEGAAGLQACATAAGLCSANELTLGDEDCMEVPDYPSDDHCGLDLHCRKPVISNLKLPGAQATLVQSGRALCRRLVAPTAPGEQAPFGCSCETSPPQGYTVLANSTPASCRAALDFCLTGKQPAFVPTSACATSAESPSADSCKSLQLCGPQMQLSAAASLVDGSLQRRVSCSPLESGVFACDCELDSSEPIGSGYSFHVAAVSPNSCDPAQCRPDVVPVATGPMGECQPLTSELSSNACTVAFACPVPASTAGHAMTIDAPLNVQCAKRVSDNTWWCACGSGPNTTRVELGAASDSEAACALAPPLCLAQMSLQLGPAQWGGAPLPNPLP